MLVQGGYQAPPEQQEQGIPLADSTEVDQQGFVAVNPETIIVQHGQEVVLASDTPGEDGANQYVIQYVMPEDANSGGEMATQSLSLQEVTIQPVGSSNLTVPGMMSSVHKMIEAQKAASAEEVMSSQQEIISSQEVLTQTLPLETSFTGDVKVEHSYMEQKVKTEETPVVVSTGLNQDIENKVDNIVNADLDIVENNC